MTGKAKVAGFGFRTSATTAALQDALAAAGGPDGLTALATVVEKASAPALLALAHSLSLPVRAIGPDALKAQTTATQSPRQLTRFGTGSLAEATALAAAGHGARLTGPRAVSQDRTATAAIAEGPDP
ncbi:cobalamin biosynthesis protein [Fertoebacter nigrum]|uniref:Cobalamin biosynthesis protein n=1 Tax=Fertoeibacter niger TaxID=2656921 RepID=A0A8X8GYR3_9RHOB|nr:cobalamin biosynthesis protein [Fertoeibacter niger]NUB46773.1 cobalamin biosynthesis protein [Fertoeibacter niger]